MWIIQKSKKVALWNKRHFEEKNRECATCLKYSVLIFVKKKYIKCNIWRVAVRPSYIWDAWFLKVNIINWPTLYSVKWSLSASMNFSSICLLHAPRISFSLMWSQRCICFCACGGGVWGSGDTAPFILNLSSWGRWVVNSTFRGPLYAVGRTSVPTE